MPVARRSLLLVLVLVLAGCGRGGADGTVAWRDLTLELPDGWTVFEEGQTLLSIANVPLGAEVSEEERPSGDVVAMFLTHRRGVTPGEWRRQIEDSGATLEVDEAIEVGGVPATRLQFLTPASEGAAETRELVVVVPAREVEVLAQPVPLPGSTGAPEVFDRASEAFDGVLASVRWGAPVEAPGS